MNKTILYPVLLVLVVWLFPAIYSLLFPFESSLETNWYLISIVLLVFAFSLAFPIMVFRGKRSFDFVRQMAGFRSRRVVLFLAFLAFFVQVVDFVFLRGVQISLSLHENRDALDDSSTPLTLLLMLLLPFVYISFIGFFERKSYLYLTPFILVSIVTLISGNRQFFTFGVILFFIFRVMVNPAFSLKSFLRFVVVFFALAAAMLAFQFKRQPYAEGNQADFIYQIANIKCSGFPCGTPLEVPFAYIYLYYGIEYAGLSSVIVHSNEDGYVRAPLLSQTIPVLYRRLSGMFELPDQGVVHKEMHDQFEARFNVFPHIWRTMFSNFVFEYGAYGVLVLSILVLCFGFYHLFILFLIGSRYSLFAVAAFYSSMMFGVMYFPLFEPHIFIMFFYLMISSLFVIVKSLLRASIKSSDLLVKVA